MMGVSLNVGFDFSFSFSLSFSLDLDFSLRFLSFLFLDEFETELLRLTSLNDITYAFYACVSPSLFCPSLYCLSRAPSLLSPFYFYHFLWPQVYPVLSLYNVLYSSIPFV
jgi:hypothetical protein